MTFLFLVVPRLSPKTHRPRSPRQNSIGNTPSGPVLASPQAGIIPTEAVAMPVPAASPTPASPASNRAVTPSIEGINAEHKRGPEVTSQGVQTSSPGCKQEKDDKEEKKDAAEQVRKSTLNPNAKEFNPRSFSQPKPSTTPTSPRPQAQPSPSMVGHQQPTPVYTQPVCFAPNMMYPVPVSPGVQ
ncbi:Ataxin-2, partial [Camelus dromedarius]